MSIENKTYSLNQSPLYMLVRRAKLAKLLGLTDAQLRHLSKHSDTLYRERDIPKKSGDGLRHIENPADQLKVAQETLSKILGRITPPDYLFCPVKRRCYVTNAAQHRGHRVVRCLDIQKYFPNTKSRRVFWFFHKVMKCDRAIAGTLTKIACYKEHLPTGSPLSPIMAFFAHIDVWDAVARICAERGLTLTVYIDDITVSGNSVSEKDIWDIKREIHRSGLRYHKEKLFVDRPAEITGVFVDGGVLVPPDRQYKKIRVASAALKTNSAFASEKIQNQISGLKGQLAQIRGKNKEGSGENKKIPEQKI